MTLQTVDEPIFWIPVIPTTSLFLTEELIGEKLDPFISRIEAESASFSKLLKARMPYKWLKYKERKAPYLDLLYDRKRNAQEPFGLSLTVELALKLDIPEMWIQKLIFHFVDKRWRDRHYTFINKPITLGSRAEAFVYNFYKKRKMTNWIKKIPRRHLELTDASGLEPFYWHESSFISFLSNATHGLVMKKKVRKMPGDRLVDEDIAEVTLKEA